MLEDCAMEKKGSVRSVQPPLKGNVTESKKNQDATCSKTRYSRRREPPNFSGYEQSRKPLPQKNKSYKRPKPRGQSFGCGKENPKVAEDEAEYGSVLMPGSKKQNLNHLLNFHYAPRDNELQTASNWRSSHSSGGRYGPSKWLIGTHKHKYNKEQFLQANCQFVVKSDGNYTAYMSNPDLLVDWDLVEQIRFQSFELLSCPICLYPPVAAKITRCGHVYCWSCILHYLALSEKSWGKCPICFEAVHKQDLKSVIAVPHGLLSVGSNITFRLMKRGKGSLISFPVDQQASASCNKLLSVSDSLADTKYSKLLLANPKDVEDIMARERIELQLQLADEINSSEVCFIEQALQLLRQREELLYKNITNIHCNTNVVHDFNTIQDTCNSEMTQSGVFNEDLSVHVQNVGDHTGDKDVHSDLSHCNSVERQRQESLSSDGTNNEKDIIYTPDQEIPLSGEKKILPQKYFFFYQAEDGQHVYLHAVNARMLEYQYGSLEFCPPTITGKIIEKESGSMTDELRKRFRYLQHLPVTCQFEVVEIELKYPVVSRDTLDHFHDQLEQRKRRRQHRAKQERRREKKISEEENRMYGRFPTPRIKIESHHQFPLCGSDGDMAGTSIPHSPSNTSVASSTTPSVEDVMSIASGIDNLELDPTENLPKQEVNSSEKSFAQMLREGKTRLQSEWPARKREVVKENFVATNRTSDSEPELDGYVPVPAYKQSFSDAIALAFEKTASSRNYESDAPATTSKKKKKMKQKVLFATGMAYLNN